MSAAGGGSVKAFMQFVEKSTDKLLFDKVIQLCDEVGEHHSIKQWFTPTYNNNGNRAISSNYRSHGKRNEDDASGCWK